jgi:hypothetical protein
LTPQEVSVGDTILVIDGQPEHFYWKGQNQRTFEIGFFPRKLVHNVAGKRAKDIRNRFNEATFSGLKVYGQISCTLYIVIVRISS